MEHAEVRVGPRRGNVEPRGNDVSVTRTGDYPAVPVDCGNRLPAFPENATAPATAMSVPPEDSTFYVAASGTGDYYSIQRAIDVAPPSGAVISIAPGTYYEVVSITKPNFRLRSPYLDATKTVITFDGSARSHGSTLKPATVTVLADNFVAENLTIANGKMGKVPKNGTASISPVQQSKDSQPPALDVTGDRAVFRNVRLLGNQNTLYAGSKDCPSARSQPCTPSRLYFSGCYIEGYGDMISGDGKAAFDRCEIHSTKPSTGFITAQGKHYPEQDSGFVFDHCNLTAEPGGTDIWLRRPGRPYASVVFLNTQMGGHIRPAGWQESDPGETNSLTLAFFGEYNSSGPGAHPGERNSRSKQLSAEEAALFEFSRFLAGPDQWDPTKRAVRATPSIFHWTVFGSDVGGESKVTLRFVSLTMTPLRYT